MKNRVFELLKPTAYVGDNVPDDDCVVEGSLLVLDGTPDEISAIAQQTGRDVYPITAEWLAASVTKPYEVLQ